MSSESEEIPSESIVAKIKRHWQGKGTLAWAYWGFGVAGGLVLLAILAVAFLFILPFAYSPNKSVQGSPIFAAYLVSAGGIYASYVTATVVMVFRCGENVGWPGWKYVARFAVVIWLAKILIALAVNVL